MPTPSSDPPELPPRSHSSSCPDELRSSSALWRVDRSSLGDINMDGGSSTPEPSATLSDESALVEDIESDTRSTAESPGLDSRLDVGPPRSRQPQVPDGLAPQSGSKSADIKDEDSSSVRRVATRNASSRGLALDVGSPMSTESDRLAGNVTWVSRVQHDEYAPSMGYDFTNVRIIPTSPSSYLRPGSKFHGTQQSERQIYDVQVEIKYVDLQESYMCGYLKIQGLTRTHPTLTTYFDAEMIGTKYGFFTQHQGWGASEKVDLSHWNKFAAFRPYAKQARKGNVRIPDFANKDNVFMRWKERFVVPDHRLKDLNGASFAGFYYICFNQKEGVFTGIYFHQNSEKFQNLELKHVENRGCFGSLEFR